MNRRGFLGALLGGASALVLDPEKALWVPGKKLISVPRLTGNVFLTPEMMARLALECFQKHLQVAREMSRQYDEGFMIGESVTVRKPYKYLTPA